jgi:hypothetical protein
MYGMYTRFYDKRNRRSRTGATGRSGQRLLPPPSTTMPKRSVQPQGLDQCVHSLSSITSRNVSTKSVQELGDLYLACMSLLIHLKADQVKLQHSRRYVAWNREILQCLLFVISWSKSPNPIVFFSAGSCL